MGKKDKVEIYNKQKPLDINSKKSKQNSQAEQEEWRIYQLEQSA